MKKETRIQLESLKKVNFLHELKTGKCEIFIKEAIENNRPLLKVIAQNQYLTKENIDRILKEKCPLSISQLKSNPSVKCETQKSNISYLSSKNTFGLSTQTSCSHCDQDCLYSKARK